MPFSRSRLDGLPAAAITVASVIVGALVFGRFLYPHAVPVGFDEGYMVSFAERLIDGRWLPYVDAVSQRGPVLYWVLALAQIVFGRFEWVGIRVVGLAACLVVVLATYLAGVAARWPLAGAFGGAATVLVVAAYGGTRGVYGETVATPLLAIAFCLLAVALRRARAGRRRLSLLVLAGAFAALATLTKQTVGIASGPFLLWVIAHAVADPVAAPRRRLAWAAAPLAFLAGWIGVVAAVVSFYAAHHALGELVYWGVTYNAEIYMGPYRANYGPTLTRWLLAHTWVLAGAALAGALAVARLRAEGASWSPRSLATAYARAGFEATAAITGILLLAVALMPARFWWHYFMIVWPWLGLVVGVAVEVGLRRVRGAAARKHALVALPVAVAIAWAGGFRMHELDRARSAWRNPRPSPVCAAIDRYAKPGDPIFVWGFDGDVYINCRRKPAARFTYLTLVAGIVPPFWNVARPDRVARGAREALLADLEQSRPPVIVDYPIHGFSMDKVPELAALLARDYCPLPRMGGKVRRKPKLYGRRDVVACSEAVAPVDEGDGVGEGGDDGLEGGDMVR